MTKSEFEAMTKDELVAYADERDIEVHHHWVKDEIIAEIMKAEKKAAREEAKQDVEHGPPSKGMPVAKQQQVDPETGVSSELAELQRQANGPVDDSTRFAAKHPLPQMDTYQNGR